LAGCIEHAPSPDQQTAAIEQGNIVLHRPSLECDKRKREQAAGKAGFPRRNGADDIGGERAGGRFVKTLVLQDGSL